MDIILKIEDANICETLLHYGKLIGVNILMQPENSGEHCFLQHQNDFLEVKIADDLLKQFALPCSLNELGEFLLKISTGSALKVKNLIAINADYLLDIQRKSIVAVENTEQILVVLTEKESEMLRFIASAKELGADKDLLLQQVWGYSPEAKSRTIEAHLYRLRQKLVEYLPNFPAINVEGGKCYLVTSDNIQIQD